MEYQLKDYVKDVRVEQRMSMREFAEALTECVKGSVSHASVNEWEKGRYEPGTTFLLQVLVAYSDWRRVFAQNALKLVLPEVFVDQADELHKALFSRS